MRQVLFPVVLVFAACLASGFSESDGVGMVEWAVILEPSPALLVGLGLIAVAAHRSQRNRED
jgi:hypothetical protein